MGLRSRISGFVKSLGGRKRSDQNSYNSESVAWPESDIETATGYSGSETASQSPGFETGDGKLHQRYPDADRVGRSEEGVAALRHLRAMEGRVGVDTDALRNERYPSAGVQDSRSDETRFSRVSDELYEPGADLPRNGANRRLTESQLERKAERLFDRLKEIDMLPSVGEASSSGGSVFENAEPPSRLSSSREGYGSASENSFITGQGTIGSVSSERSFDASFDSFDLDGPQSRRSSIDAMNNADERNNGNVFGFSDYLDKYHPDMPDTGSDHSSVSSEPVSNPRSDLGYGSYFDKRFSDAAMSRNGSSAVDIDGFGGNRADNADWTTASGKDLSINPFDNGFHSLDGEDPQSRSKSIGDLGNDDPHQRNAIGFNDYLDKYHPEVPEREPAGTKSDRSASGAFNVEELIDSHTGNADWLASAGIDMNVNPFDTIGGEPDRTARDGSLSGSSQSGSRSSASTSELSGYDSTSSHSDRSSTGYSSSEYSDDASSTRSSSSRSGSEAASSLGSVEQMSGPPVNLYDRRSDNWHQATVDGYDGDVDEPVNPARIGHQIRGGRRGPEMPVEGHMHSAAEVTRLQAHSHDNPFRSGNIEPDPAGIEGTASDGQESGDERGSRGLKQRDRSRSSTR